MSGRNHYKGRPDPDALRSQVDILKRDRDMLEEQNAFLKARTEELTSLVASLQRLVEGRTALAPPSSGPTTTKTTGTSEEPDIFINPMSEEKTLIKSFDELGEEKKEAQSKDEVDKLRELLGNKRR